MHKSVKILVLAFFFACCPLARANTVYLSQSAGTFSGGTACNGQTTQAYTYFNSSGNWTSGAPTGSKIGPGTTVYICGSIIGTTAFQPFVFQGSGSSGSPVTLLFDSGAFIQASYCSPSGCIYSNGKSNLTVDGGTNGYIQNTLNGTSGGTCPGGPCQYQQAAEAIEFGGCVGCTVQNLLMENIYVRSSQSDEVATGDCIDAPNGANNLTLSNNVCHDVSTTLYWEYQGTGSNSITIKNNTAYNISAGFALADHCCTPANLSSALVYGNNVHDFANWSDQCCGYNFHHDGVHLWAVHTGATISGVYIFNNYFGGDFGAGTALNYIEIDGTGNTATVYLFNNVYNVTGDTGSTSGGGAAWWVQTADGSANIVNTFFYNNTLFCPSNLLSAIWLEGGGGPITSAIENNIISNYGTLFVTTTSGMLSTLTQNYNDWYDPSYGGNGIWSDNNGGYISLATWRSHSALDANSVLANPLLMSNGTLQPGSGAIALGTNLFAICNGQPNPGLGALCSDKGGNPRPSTGNWDAGAYVYTGPGSGLAAKAN